MQVDFRIFRRFIRIVNPGKILNLPSPRFFIQTFWITLFRRLQRTIDEYLNEFKPGFFMQLSAPARGLSNRD